MLDAKQAMRGDGKDALIKNDFKIHPNIFTYGVGGERTGHPAAFPNKLAEDHIISLHGKKPADCHSPQMKDDYQGIGICMGICKKK